MSLTARVAILALLLASPLFADWPAEKSSFEAAYGAETPEARIAAVKALHEFDHPEGMALLLAAYSTEKDFDVRHVLADAMNAITNVRARDVFRDTILKHPEAETRVRFCALFADGRMLDRFEMLRFLLRDPSELVRARALRNLGDTDAALIADASKLVDDDIADVRMAACGALGVVKSAEAGPALIRVLEKEKLAEIRWAAGDALGKISGEMNGEDVAAWKKWWSNKMLAAMGPVEKALWRGGEFLKGRLTTLLDTYKNAKGPIPGDDSMRLMNVRGITLIIYAMIHAGVPMDDPLMKEGIEVLEKMPINSTYDVSICAMALADVDAAGHRERLAEIAQWLCDTQCTNGQWSYGSWTGQVVSPAKPGPEKKTETPSPKAGGETAAEAAKIRIAWRNHQRSPTGDNSNTQYALLGLRACLGAADIPKPVWQVSLSYFRKTQAPDGSWGYGPGQQPGYGSMTVGGVAAV
ncbi:MAG: HEAT repeat domain-containing protein, partial [Planctomycetes bacterium]|nr:HEAT repeat domain-containing protein [Planctomycetota bacterium]